MISRAQKVRLGVFMAGSLALLLTTIVVLAGLEIAKSEDFYTVRYTVSLSGLENGASVKYNGIRVGQVETIAIDRDDVSVVVVTLKLAGGTPIKTDTKAVIGMSGITGLKYIELSGGTSASAFVEPGGEIQAGESFLDKLSGKAEVIAEKAELLLNQINQAITPENRDRVMKTIDDFDALVVTSRETIEENRENLRAVMHSLRDAGENLNVTVKNLEREATGALVASRQLMEGLKDSVDKERVSRIVGNLDRITASLRTGIETADLPALTGKIRDIADSAKRAMENIDLTVLRSREKIYTALAYLAEGLENFSEFARNIRENPSLLLSGPQETERDLP